MRKRHRLGGPITVGVPVALMLVALTATESQSQTTAMTGRIDAGTFHACVVLSDGTVRCWGRNTYGQLGDSTSTNSTTPVSVSGISAATAIAGGGSAITGDAAHTCALLSGGTVRCWGLNNVGQLGNGTNTDASTPVQVSGISTATAIATGGAHTCVVLSDGTARCWGLNNTYGQLGDETTTNRSTPVQVKGIGGATAITAGSHHTCALLSRGEVWCWGRQDSGQLGNGVFRNQRAPFDAQLKPVQVVGINTATAIVAGDVHTCALLSDGTVWCWGSNFAGGLGDGTTTSFATPVQVSGITTAKAIAAGTYHTCAMLSDSSMRCWGGNYFGALGNGTTGNGTDAANTTTPVSVSGISTGTAPTAGGLYTCATLSDGTARCWGSNFYGQLGNGTNTDASTPVQVSGISTATVQVPVTSGTILSITKRGEGTVTSSPAGINCGPDCSEPYASGTVVTLTPTPAAGWRFDRWRGDADCTDGVVTMNANKTCTAEFKN